MNYEKIDSRILDMFNKREFDQDFINIELDPSLEDKLLDYQHIHVFNLISCLKKSVYGVAVDGSSTGLGKSYTSIAVCKQLGLIPFIITPKSIMGTWKYICENHFDIKPLGIINYEMLKNGNYYNENGTKKEAPFLKIENGEFKWNFKNPKKILVIFDEVHRCKNKNSLNGKLLMSLKNVAKLLLLSATLADTPNNFHVFGYMLGFYNDIKKSRNWISGVLQEQKSSSKRTNILSLKVFPNKGSKMTLDDLGDKFPKNQISAECYTLNEKEEKEIENEYSIIKSEYNKNSISLVKILKARQKIELIKIPIFIELTEKYLEINRSVVIFLNFIETFKTLITYFQNGNIDISCIHGSQTKEERYDEIQKFQLNKTKIIIVMIQAGGQSINLHDTNGKYPRISIISPSFSSIELKQALGRIYRVGTKSPVLQRIIFCSGTHEENICNKIKKKLKFMEKLNDDDLIKL